MVGLVQLVVVWVVSLGEVSLAEMQEVPQRVLDVSHELWGLGLEVLETLETV